jgi:group I intron endonuclease
MKDNWCVYVHTNKVNGLSYVGATSRDPMVRWGSNGCNYKPDNGKDSHKKFWNAIQEFGWDGFTHEILERNLSEKEAYEKESYYIAKYNSYDNGYNCTTGGTGCPGRTQTEETRKKMSKTRTGKKHTEEWSRNISKSQKIKRKVICLETGIIYDSPHDCADKMGLDFRGILAICKDDRINTEKTTRKLTLHGFHFQYADKEIKTIQEIESKRNNRHRRKPVVCLETCMEYDSAIECAKQNNISRSSVENACKNHYAVYGKHYKYINDPITIEGINDMEMERSKIHNPNDKRIICIEDGKVFATQKECGEYYGISATMINMVCRGRQKKAAGLHFAYAG